MSKEEFGIEETVGLVLRDKNGKVKATRGLTKYHDIVKADETIKVVNKFLEVIEELNKKDELQEFIVCPNCGYDKFRYLLSGKLHCQKCDNVFVPEIKGKKK